VAGLIAGGGWHNHGVTHPDPAIGNAALLRRGRALEAITLAWNVIGIAVLAVAARCCSDSS
jgi:hypothetical protein